MRDAFLKQLEELHKMLAEMGSLCEDMIDGTYEALMNMDRDQAAKILTADANVDLKERDIESKCLKLLLEQQPVASESGIRPAISQRSSKRPIFYSR